MPFVSRTDGKITGTFACQQHEGQEWVEADAEELLLFRNPPKTDAQINEEKIQAKMREMAIDGLIKEGALPQDYK